uniref:T-box domain-containing protein n=1 Tax=Haemonchus contortus TaxID=6289 RepID=A0A7I5E9W0_HAECO
SHYSSTIGATLVTEGLWRKFHQHTTEMIVTKSGRKIFPKLEYKLHGMDPNESYALMLHIERADDMRYKFSAGDWSTKWGKESRQHPSRGVPHHDLTIDTGRGWMSKTVAFDRVKSHKQSTGHGYVPCCSSIDAQIRSGPVRLPNARYDNVVEPKYSSVGPVFFGCSDKVQLHGVHCRYCLPK